MDRSWLSIIRLKGKGIDRMSSSVASGEWGCVGSRLSLPLPGPIGLTAASIHLPRRIPARLAIGIKQVDRFLRFFFSVFLLLPRNKIYRLCFWPALRWHLLAVPKGRRLAFRCSTVVFLLALSLARYLVSAASLWNMRVPKIIFL